MDLAFVGQQLPHKDNRGFIVAQEQFTLIFIVIYMNSSLVTRRFSILKVEKMWLETDKVDVSVNPILVRGRCRALERGAATLLANVTVRKMFVCSALVCFRDVRVEMRGTGDMSIMPRVTYIRGGGPVDRL